MDILEFLKYIGGIGGLGAIFAIIMFWIYRHDKQCSEKHISEVILDYKGALKQHSEAFEKQRDAIERQTLVLTELTDWLKMRNGHGH